MPREALFRVGEMVHLNVTDPSRIHERTIDRSLQHVRLFPAEPLVNYFPILNQEGSWNSADI